MNDNIYGPGNDDYGRNKGLKGDLEELNKILKPWMGVVKSNIKMKPTIGRIVVFNMPDHLKNGVNGNKSEKLPAVIVAVWSDIMVNLKVITDGQNDLWVTSVHQGDEPNQWNWPVID